jgi:hypothetical protein
MHLIESSNEIAQKMKMVKMRKVIADVLQSVIP